MPDIIVNTGGTDWLTPTATLLAVLFGGFVNWWAQTRLADRRADAEAKASAEREKVERAARLEDAEAVAAVAARIAAAETRSAARVVQGDLSMAAGRLQNMVEKDPRWYGYEDLLPNWDEQKAVLARELEADPWEVVSQSALELRGLSAGMRRTLGPGGPDEGKLTLPLSPTQLQGLGTMWANASEAHRALAGLAGTQLETGLLHQGT